MFRNGAELQHCSAHKDRKNAAAGHVQRMVDQRTPEKLLTSHPDGLRNVGRPKLRWLDGVDRKQDVNTMDRDLWRNLLERARGNKGL